MRLNLIYKLSDIKYNETHSHLLIEIQSHLLLRIILNKVAYWEPVSTTSILSQICPKSSFFLSGLVCIA